jgi:phosphate-selective porin OprO/OprP
MPIVMYIIILFYAILNFSYADELTLQKQIDAQQEIIENQSKRIDELEVLIKGIKNDVIDDNINIKTSNNEKDKNVEIEPTNKDMEDMVVSAKGKKYNPETAFFGPLPQLRSSDGKYSLGLMGLIQLDGAIYNQEANYNTNNDLSDGFIVRRAGLTAAGVSEKDWIWFLSYDYADSGDNPHDALRAAMGIYRGFKPWWIFAGLFGSSVSLDASSFSSQRQFMEAAIAQSTFIYGAGSPAMGVAATYRGDDYYVRFGLYGEPYKNASTDDEGMGLHGRFIWQPIKQRNEAVQLGLTGYYRTANNSNTFTNGLRDSTLRFRSKGESSLSGDFILDTGVIKDLDTYYYIGYEFANVQGPLSIQTEWGILGINRKTQTETQFSGGYVQGGYMLTDDARNYNAYFAQFWRLKPKLSIMEGGIGAWEVALRASKIDLNDEDIQGGEASSYTLGLNWYMTAFTKTMFNIIHTDSSGPLSEDFNSIGARLQIEF